MFYSEEDSCKCNWQQVSFSSVSAQPISEGTKVLRRRGAQGLWAHGNTWEGYSQAVMFIVVAGKGYTHFATLRSPLPLPSTDYSNELRGDLYACLWSSMFLWTLSEFRFLCCLFSGYSACLSVEGADSWLCDHYCNSGTQNTGKKKIHYPKSQNNSTFEGRMHIPHGERSPLPTRSYQSHHMRLEELGKSERHTGSTV